MFKVKFDFWDKVSIIFDLLCVGAFLAIIGL